MNEIPIVSQSTVVDIRPLSRFQPRGVEPDTVPDEADVVTHLVLAEPLTERGDPQRLFGADRVMVSEDRFSVTVHDHIQVPPAEKEHYYWLRLEVPQRGTELAGKGNDISTLVLLPRANLHGNGKGPVYDVCLENVRIDPEPELHQAGPVIYGVGGLPALGGRIAVALHTREDPEDFWYYYNMIRERLPD
jgi:hypothetical protein